MLLVAHLVSGQDVLVRRDIQRHLELEDVLSEPQLLQQRNTRGLEYWIWRSEANNLKVLRIVDPGQGRRYSVNIRLCLSPTPPFRNVTVQVENIRYSNDGPSDTLYVQIGNSYNGTYRTFESWGGGHEWNVFHNTGPIGRPTSLPEGEYTLSLQAKTDRWGVEYDRIAINADGQNDLVQLICDSELTGPAPRIYIWPPVVRARPSPARPPVVLPGRR